MISESVLSTKYEKAFFALGTINTIAAFGRNSERAAESAYKRVIEIDDRMSGFKENSDIVLINKNAGIQKQKVNEDTFKLLERAIHFSKLSKGAFDITVCPLTALWGFGRKQNYVPASSEIKKAMSLVNYEDLQLDKIEGTAFLKNKGQAIDLGGIAKGYAADEVKRILLEHGVKDALINLGGNLIALGKNRQGEDWRIGIQNPLAQRGEYLGTVKVQNKTIVTSGSNEQFFVKDGIRYHHIIDPHTGYPSRNGLLSVTVIGENSMEADAITTSLFIMNVNEASSMLRSIEAEAVFVMENGDIFLTEGVVNNFERSVPK